MASNSRTENTIRNFKIGLIMQIIGFALSFVNRTIFINTVGTSYLGVNQLFTNILSLLSFAEFGSEAVFTSLLYKPLRDGDTNTINSIIKCFKKTFLVISGIVLSAGLIYLVCDPNLSLIVKENADAKTINDLPIIYILFLIGSAFNYLVAHNISLIRADQKTYIISICDELIAILQYVLQIVLVLIFHNFILYVAVQVGLQIIRDIILSVKSRKMFPYLKEKAEPLNPEIQKTLITRIKGGACLHVGSIVTNGTDNLVISAFIGVAITGLYSNYLMIITIVGCLLNIVYNSINASIGDLVAEGNVENIYSYFNKLQFISFAMVTIFSCGMLALFNPFITIWVGSENTFPEWLVILIVSVFIMGSYGIKRPLTIFKNASGLFYNDKWFYVIEAAVNVIISVGSAWLFCEHFGYSFEYGFAGIMAGTIISSIITLVSGAYVLYKHLFKKPLKEYYIKMLEYLLFVAVVATACVFLTKVVDLCNIILFILAGLVVVFGVGILILLVFWKTDECKFVISIIKRKLLRTKKKQS